MTHKRDNILNIDQNKEYSPFRKSLFMNQNKNTLNTQNSDDIILLKKKLLDVHNRLLKQLQINKQKEAEINKLKSIKNDQSSLKTDLENLRTRLLAQILQKNRARQQLRNLIEKYHSMDNKLNQALEQLKTKQSEIKKLQQKLISYKTKLKLDLQQNDNKVNTIQNLNQENSSLKAKNVQLQAILKEEKNKYANISQQNKNLLNKVINQQTQINELEQTNLDLKNKFYMDNNQRILILNKNSQIQKLTAEINILSIKLKEKDKQFQEFKNRNKHLKNTPYKKDYDQTRLLIQKLQEAQLQMRHKNTYIESNIQKFQSPSRFNSEGRDYLQNSQGFSRKRFDRII